MSTKLIKCAVRAALNDSSTLELHFLDLIYNTASFDWWTGEIIDTNIVADIIEQVKAANPSRILCIIDSQGGDAGIGLAVYNFLKSYPAKVEVEILGMAGSIASVIAMAASKGKLRMARNAFMVIHRAWGGGIGTSDDLREAADVVDRYTATIVDVYSQRTGMSTEEITALIAKGDYWMNGTEAQSLGFADELINDNAQFQIAARVKGLDPAYRNMPHNLTTPAPKRAKAKGSPEDAEEIDERTSTSEGTPGEDGANEDTSPAGILNKINNFFNVDLKNLVSAALGGSKTKNEAKGKGTNDKPKPANEAKPKPKPKATDPDEDEDENDEQGVSADLDLPTVLNAFAEGLQAELKTELDEREESIMNAVDKKYGKVIKNLTKENAQLKKDLAEEEGEETNTADTRNDTSKKPVGFFGAKSED